MHVHMQLRGGQKSNGWWLSHPRLLNVGLTSLRIVEGHDQCINLSDWVLILLLLLNFVCRKNMEIPILKSSARVTSRLNYLCPQFFPGPESWSLGQLNNITQNSAALKEVCSWCHHLWKLHSCFPKTSTLYTSSESWVVIFFFPGFFSDAMW